MNSDKNFEQQRAEFQELCIAAYAKYWDEFSGDNNLQLENLSYEELNLLNLDNTYFFGMMAHSNINELINSINEFRSRLFDAAIWSRVLKSYAEREILELLYHLVKPIIHQTILFPYAIRAQFVYVSTLLTHLANRTGSKTWKDMLFDDEEKPRFYEKILVKSAEPWPSFSPYFDNLTKLNSERFRTETKEYRNRSQHGIPPTFEWGEVEFMRRGQAQKTSLESMGDGKYALKTHEKEKVISYSMVSEKPIKLDDVIPYLVEQHQAAILTYKSFWDLFLEQLSSLRNRGSGTVK